MNQAVLRLILNAIIIIIKTGQVKNVLSLLLWAIKSKMAYDEAMARLNGTWYENQVKTFVEEYKASKPEVYEADPIHIAGYDNYKKAIEGSDKK